MPSIYVLDYFEAERLREMIEEAQSVEDLKIVLLELIEMLPVESI